MSPVHPGRMSPSIRALPLVALLSLAPAAPAAAQALGGCDPDGPTPSFLSAANEVFYGCQALFRSTPPQYFSAIGRFRSALARDPNDAVALFLLGAAYAGYDQPDSARAAVVRALRIDAGVGRRLAQRFDERPALRDRLVAAVNGATAPAAPPAAPGAAPAPAPAPAPPPAPAPAPARGRPAFAAGDTVEVLGPGDAWERGVVVSANDENRDGSLWTYHVRRRLVPTDPTREVVSKFYPPRIRAALGPAPALAAAPALGGSLVYADYACTYDTWTGPPAARVRRSESKGSLLLRRDGTYRRFANGANGRYTYDAATGAITWLTGDLADMRPERTTFRRNQATAQIDIRLSGDYEWSCGAPLR